MAAVLLEPKKVKSFTVSTISPSICHEVKGSNAMIFVFWMLSFKLLFHSSFTFIKRLFRASSLSAIRVMSSAYVRLLLFLPVILIPAFTLSSSIFFFFFFFCYKVIPWACVLSYFSRVQLFATLWTVTHQAPLSLGFFRQEYWSWLPCPPPGYLPSAGIKPTSLVLLHCQVGSLPLEPPGKPLEIAQVPLNHTYLRIWTTYYVTQAGLVTIHTLFYLLKCRVHTGKDVGSEISYLGQICYSLSRKCRHDS